MQLVKRYSYRQGGLAGEVFLDPDRVPETVALFCFGFPGNMGANATVQFLVSLGHAVVVHQYSGTYDSDGVFAPDSAISSVVELAQHVATGNFNEVKKGKRIPLGEHPTVKILAGHSFGCFLGGRAATRIRSVETVLLLAPILGYGHSPVNYGVLEDGIAQLEYVQRARPHTYRFGDLDAWRLLFRGERNIWDNAGTPSKRLLAVVGQNDPDFDSHIIVSEFPAIARSVFGSASIPSIQSVSEAGHGDSELLTDEVREWIRTKLP